MVSKRIPSVSVQAAPKERKRSHTREHATASKLLQQTEEQCSSQHAGWKRMRTCIGWQVRGDLTELRLPRPFLPLVLQLWSLCLTALLPSSPMLWSVSLTVAELQDSFKNNILRGQSFASRGIRWKQTDKSGGCLDSPLNF